MKLRLHKNRQSIKKENRNLVIVADLTKPSVFLKKAP